jgi:hypothetical protein
VKIESNIQDSRGNLFLTKENTISADQIYNSGQPKQNLLQSSLSSLLREQEEQNKQLIISHNGSTTDVNVIKQQHDQINTTMTSTVSTMDIKSTKKNNISFTLDPNDLLFYHVQHTNLKNFQKTASTISFLYNLLKELETECVVSLAAHYSLYSTSLDWKILYYRIMTINHWCNILYTCDLTEELTL